ncbi:hypothetical protein QQ045_023432 [Rhodiola kirilowii]
MEGYGNTRGRGVGGKQSHGRGVGGRQSHGRGGGGKDSYGRGGGVRHTDGGRSRGGGVDGRRGGRGYGHSGVPRQSVTKYPISSIHGLFIIIIIQVIGLHCYYSVIQSTPHEAPRQPGESAILGYMSVILGTLRNLENSVLHLTWYMSAISETLRNLENSMFFI